MSISFSEGGGCALCGGVEGRKADFRNNLGDYSEGLAIYAESEHFIRLVA